jgi:hypothetical protein
MSTHWVASSTALPHEGDCVEFVLDGRSVPMDGTYEHQTFQSRWSDYDVQRVRTWRSADKILPTDQQRIRQLSPCASRSNGVT